MKNDGRLYFSCFVLCILLFQTPLFSFAQNTATTSVDASAETAASAKRAPVAEENLIHSGDLIDVDVAGSSEYDWRGNLTPEGFLSGINFTENPIYALCQTEDSVAEKIAAAYARILRQPQVVVRILDRSGRPLSMLFGAVKKNQRFQIKRPILLNELIVVAGGFTDKASGDIQIFRPANVNCMDENSSRTENSAVAAGEQNVTPAQTAVLPQYINVKIADLLAGRSNPQILSGDIVTVLEAKPIYVIGAVGVPKQIPVRAEQITLTRAVDSAGGILKNADSSRVTIFRRGSSATEGETKTIEADLNKIKAGQAEDPILQAFDVVEVTLTGREKRKFPPVLKTDDTNKAVQNLPLRVID